MIRSEVILIVEQLVESVALTLTFTIHYEREVIHFCFDGFNYPFAEAEELFQIE